MRYDVKYLVIINPLNAELYPICHLLALFGAHGIFHVSGVRVKQLLLQDMLRHISQLAVRCDVTYLLIITA